MDTSGILWPNLWPFMDPQWLRMLVDLAKEPAVIEGEFKHSWGTVPWFP